MFLPVAVIAATAGQIQVVAEDAGQTLDAVENNTTIIKQIDYIGLDPDTKPVTTTIQFSGSAATPSATIMLTVPDARWSQTSTVSADGRWNIVLPTSALTNGDYYAYVAAADQADASLGAALPAAYFSVQVDQNLSVATWTFLLTSGLTIFALLLAITLQLRYNGQHHPVL